MRSYIETLKNAIGPEQEFSLQHRIFNSALIASLASFIPGAIFMLFHGKNGFIASGGLAIYSILYSYIFHLSRYKHELEKAVLFFTIVGGSLLNIGWIFNQGETGTATYFIFMVMIIIIFTSEKPILYIAAVIVNIIILSIVDQSIQEMFDWSLPNSRVGQISTLIVALVYVSILTMMYRGLIQHKTDQTIVQSIEKIYNESVTVNQKAEIMSQRGQDLLSLTIQQTTAIEELAATTEELNATAAQNNNLTTTAINNVRDTETSINNSQHSLEQMVQSITDIRNSSTEIKNINTVIDEIAYQTNLLSLNAMIEAARSDENGGFKVVALEVKKLAERSQQAAENINQLLNKNFDAVQQGAIFANDMQHHFVEMSEKIAPLINRIQNIADASFEQREAIKQISQGLGQISQTIESNKALAEQSSQNAEELDENAESLLAIVNDLQSLANKEE